MEQLLQALSDANMLDECGDIILERYDNGGYQSVGREAFESMFGAILHDPEIEDKHAALLAADGGRGYARFFDSWQAAGII